MLTTILDSVSRDELVEVLRKNADQLKEMFPLQYNKEQPGKACFVMYKVANILAQMTEVKTNDSPL